MSVFKNCDIRGVYGVDLDDAFAYHLGQAIGSRVGDRAIVVGGDLRVSTPPLKESLIKGLVASGSRVLDVGVVPTPTLYFAKHRLRAYAGAIVTASHNPAQYNGFKLMIGDMPVTPEVLQTIAADMEQGACISGQGTRCQVDIIPDYVTMLEGACSGLARHRLVVDAGNGSMSELAPQVLRRLGQDVIELYCRPDGTFPKRDPNPAVPSHLADLVDSVCQHKAELGVAYDGDGDRVIFVDGAGHVQPADRTFVLFVRHVLQAHPGAGVVYDLKSSRVVEEEIERGGGVALMERSGHAFIKRRMFDEGARLGGEISGHCFFQETRGDDALYATLYLLRILDALGVSYQEAMSTVPAYAATPDIRLSCPPDTAREIIAQLETTFADQRLNRLDGVRIQFARGWALARLSVTEPLITLRFEADSEEDLIQIQSRVREGSTLLMEIWPGV